MTLATICQHYWDIETPGGETAEGVCRNCGEKKDFDTAVDEVYGAMKRRCKVCGVAKVRTLKWFAKDNSKYLSKVCRECTG